MLNKDEFMPVLGIAVMTAFLFVILKEYGTGTIKINNDERGN